MNLALEFPLRDQVAVVVVGDGCQGQRLSLCTSIPTVAQFFRSQPRESRRARAA
jgi:hypothetical protein